VNGDLEMLIIFVVLCLASGGIGSIFTASSVKTWYPTLKKPTWTPPRWIFGPVWTTLYILMAVAAWLVLRTAGWHAAQAAMIVFFGQLFLNTIWSILFFGLKNPGAAFSEIVLLWLAILATIVLFFQQRALGGWLMLPYLGWVTYAAALNFTIWRLNS
jgi:benzodiazapine receptor